MWTAALTYHVFVQDELQFEICSISTEGVEEIGGTCKVKVGNLKKAGQMTLELTHSDVEIASMLSQDKCTLSVTAEEKPKLKVTNMLPRSNLLKRVNSCVAQGMCV